MAAPPRIPSDQASQASASRQAGDDPPPRPEIRILPDHIVDQIAAGEVVERPASVVKELVENALDAGATHVTVEVEQGGKHLIRVLDNGCGMTREDARLALMRHATSKLRALDDLFTLDTMGFRGEALPSIAAVSRTTLTTRVRDHVAGVRLDIEAGQIVAESEVGAPVGTQIEIRDLLYNVPARLKFLKGNATEASHVTEVVSKLAMAHPHVHLRLRHGSRTALEAPLHKSRLDRVRALLGTRLGRRIHPVAGEEQGIEVEAYLAAPELAQTTARGIQIYVGRRPVKDRGLLHAIGMGYGELVPRGRYPVAVLFVDLPGPAVDVNVHPQKLEVRFSDAQAVYAAVRHVIRQGVAEAPWLADAPDEGSSPVHMRAIAASRPPRQQNDAPPGRASALAAGHAAETTRMLLFDSVRLQPTPPAPAARARPEPAPHPPALPDDASAGSGEFREIPFPLGDVPGQRAAGAEPARTSAGPAETASPAEAGSRARTQAPAAPVAGEALASPEPGPLASTLRTARTGPCATAPYTEAAAGADHLHDPAPAGFFSRLHYIGQLDRTYLLCESAGELVLVDQHAAHERVAFQRLRERYKEHAIPVQRMLFPLVVELSPPQSAVAMESSEDLESVGFELEPFGGDTFALKAVPAGLPQADAAQVLAELLDELVEQGGSRALEERLDLALATIACHSVVRAGDTLSAQEVNALFQSMDQVDFRAHCPHGRPVLLRISVAEIARRFGRT